MNQEYVFGNPEGIIIQFKANSRQQAAIRMRHVAKMMHGGSKDFTCMGTLKELVKAGIIRN